MAWQLEALATVMSQWCRGGRSEPASWPASTSRHAPGSTHAASEHAQHWLIASSCRLCIHAAGAVLFKAFCRSSEQPGVVWHTANSDGHIAASRSKGGKG